MLKLVSIPCVILVTWKCSDEVANVLSDVQGGIVLDTWSEERSVDRKLTDVKSYAYTFLVQSFLAAPRGTGTPRSQSPMPPNRTSKLEDETEDGIDMKEIDQVLSEITSMLGHWSLYVRFVSSRAMVSHEGQRLVAQDFLHVTGWCPR